MSRIAQVLLMVAVVLGTTAATVYYTAPATATAPDVRPALIVAIAFVLAAFAIDSALVRRITYKFEVLRPPYQDTMRQLGIVAGEGKELLGRLNKYDAREDDSVAAKFWQEQVQAWTNWADLVIDWRLPHMRDHFANEADRDASAYIGTSWQHHLQTWMQVRMKRIAEMELAAATVQGELGPKPPRLAPPDFPEPPAPSGPPGDAVQSLDALLVEGDRLILYMAQANGQGMTFWVWDYVNKVARILRRERPAFVSVLRDGLTPLVGEVYETPVPNSDGGSDIYWSPWHHIHEAEVVQCAQSTVRQVLEAERLAPRVPARGHR